MMIVVVDIDGVVCEYNFKALFKRYFDVELPPNGIFAYDLADVAGVSPDDIDEMFKEQVWGEPHFIDGALETLNEWKDKYQIGILSNRLKYMTIPDLVNWLSKYKIPFSFIINKRDLVGIQYHIDDSPAKLMKINAGTKLLFDQEWNRRCLNIKGQLHRVRSWAEIREAVGAGKA